jgi:23S rRNA (adenine2503-C2)-methyltransferase
MVSAELPRILSTSSEAGPAGTTTKYRLGLSDGLAVEAVAVPMYGGSYTVCVSSQVGCARGCAFCETGTTGLSRNLSAAEIAGQVTAASEALGVRFRNVVFMGMGEPLDNPEGVFGALESLRNPRGLGYSQERITVCTAGHAEGIRRLRALGLKRLNLSVSLGSARDGLRDRLMPINRTWPLDELAETLAAYPMRRNFALGVNYCLLPGLNDAQEDLDAAAAFVRRLGRALVNVIPYNPGRHPICRAPTEPEVDAFLAGLAARGIPVRRRVEKGRSLLAACGQLGGAADSPIAS